jgi:hypothetical protein
VDKLKETSHVSYREGTSASHSHSFEVLGGHHNTHAGSSRRTVEASENTSVAHTILCCLTDGGHLYVGIRQLFLDSLGCLPHIAPPELNCGSQVNASISNPEVERIIGPSLYDELVVAGELEFRAKKPHGIRIAQDPRLRRHGADIESCTAREKRARQRPHAEEKRVLSRETISPWPDFLVESKDIQAPTTQTQTIRLRISCFSPNGPVCRIDMQECASVGVQPFPSRRL